MRQNKYMRMLIDNFSSMMILIYRLKKSNTDLGMVAYVGDPNFLGS